MDRSEGAFFHMQLAKTEPSTNWAVRPNVYLEWNFHGNIDIVEYDIAT